MRISHKHKFIFLSKPRCASTSIRTILDKYSDIFSTETLPFYHHVTACQLKRHFEQVGWDWDSYFKFITIRNPWDMLVSLYHFGKPDLNNLFYWEDQKNGEKYDPHHLMSFDEWVEKRNVTWHTLESFTFDAGGNSLVDYILKFEDLDNGVKHICEKLGLPRLNVPRTNPTEHKHYRTYYNEKTKNKISETFHLDIRVGNYEF